MDSKTFISKVSKASQLDVDTCLEFQSMLAELLKNCLASGETISIPSFGNFEPRKRNERIMAHPSVKGKRMLIPPKIVVNFKPSTVIKNKLNKLEGNE